MKRLFLNLLNRRKQNAAIPPIPPFPEIIEMMFDKSLSFSEDL